MHDIGKLGVTNAILEKPGRLTDEERTAMQAHAYYTWKITGTVPGFQDLSEVAASHHEKLDGSGYFRGLTGEFISQDARIIAVADIFDALAADRPYRKGMPMENVFSILDKEAGRLLDADCVAALKEAEIGSDQTFQDLDTLRKKLDDFHEQAKGVMRPQLTLETAEAEWSQLT